MNKGGDLEANKEALIQHSKHKGYKLERKSSNPWECGKERTNLFFNCYGLMLIIQLILFIMAVGIGIIVWIRYLTDIGEERISLKSAILSILFCEINAFAWLLLFYCYRLESHTHRELKHAATLNFEAKVLDKISYVRTIFVELENERRMGMFYFDQRLPEPYTKKFKGKWNTVLIFLFRLIWFGCSLTVIIYHALTGRIKLYYISQQSNWLAAVMNLLGIIHIFIKDKRNNFLTKIYGPLYLICIGNIFVVGCIVIPDNLGTLCKGGSIADFGVDDIVEHFLNPFFIYLPFIWEYVDIKVLWTPWPVIYGIFYIFINFVYVCIYNESIYGNLKFDNTFTVAISIVFAVMFWIPSLIAYFGSLYQKNKKLNRDFGIYHEYSYGEFPIEQQDKGSEGKFPEIKIISPITEIRHERIESDEIKEN